MARHCIIYVLCDPVTQQIRYVGKTMRGLARVKWHMYERGRRTHKDNWIRSLKKRGLEPEAVIIKEHAAPGDLDEAERFWIAYLRCIGADLTNATAGGDGQAIGDRNAMHDPAARQRFSEANRGRRFTAEHKANWLQAQNTATIKARRSELTTAQWSDQAYRDEQSERMKVENARRWADPEYRARVTARIAAANRARAK